jgi:hypothetical protein
LNKCFLSTKTKIVNIKPEKSQPYRCIKKMAMRLKIPCSRPAGHYSD